MRDEKVTSSIDVERGSTPSLLTSHLLPFRRAPPCYRPDTSPQGCVPGKPLPARCPLPRGGRMARTAGARRGSRNRAHRVLPGRRGAGSRHHLRPAIRRPQQAAPGGRCSLARCRAGILRGARQPVLQLGTIRDSWRARFGCAPCPSQDLSPHVRRVRRGALRRGRPVGPGFRYPMGQGSDTHL